MLPVTYTDSIWRKFGWRAWDPLETESETTLNENYATLQIIL